MAHNIVLVLQRLTHLPRCAAQAQPTVSRFFPRGCPSCRATHNIAVMVGLWAIALSMVARGQTMAAIKQHRQQRHGL